MQVWQKLSTSSFILDRWKAWRIFWRVTWAERWPILPQCAVIIMQRNKSTKSSGTTTRPVRVHQLRVSSHEASSSLSSVWNRKSCASRTLAISTVTISSSYGDAKQHCNRRDMRAAPGGLPQRVSRSARALSSPRTCTHEYSKAPNLIPHLCTLINTYFARCGFKDWGSKT